MMDPDIYTRINKLTQQYLESNSKDVFILDQIEYFLKLQELQTWKLKYDLRVIEHPNKFRRENNIQTYEKMFSSENAYSKYHLILPLFIYLFSKYKKKKSALESSLDFMEVSKTHLKAGDFAKTKTGAQRFITNTRFAALELRNLGLLRSDNKHFYKYWELSLFGVLVAGQLFIELEENQLYLIKTNFNWHEAKESANKILHLYIRNTHNPNQMKYLFNRLFKEDLISNYYKLYTANFISFYNKIIKVLEDGYKLGRQSTKELISYLDSINSNSEISQLTNSIILQKQFDINYDIIYKIINPNK